MRDDRTSGLRLSPELPAIGSGSASGRLAIGMVLLVIVSLLDCYRPFNWPWSNLYILVGLYAALTLPRRSEALLYGGVIVSTVLAPLLSEPANVRWGMTLYHRGTSVAIALVLIAMYWSRRRAFVALQQANAHLEDEVYARTRDLRTTNESLQREIIERRRAETQLQSARDRMRKTIEAAPIVICSFSTHPDGITRMPFASPQIRDIYGLQPEELADDFSLALERIADEDRVRVVATAQESAVSLKPWRCEYRVENPERGSIWVESHSIPSPQADGTILWHGYIADITVRKQMEAAFNESMQRLQNSEQRFRSLADAIPQMVWIANSEGKVIHVNATTSEYSGLSAGQFLGSTCEGIAHPDEGTRSVELWEDALRAGTDYYNEARFRRADGEYRWHVVRALPIRDLSGKIVEWYGTATEIEELKRVEHTLRERERFLRIVTSAARVGLVVLNERCEFLFANETYADIVKRDLDDIIGRHLKAVLPEAWSQIAPHLERVLAGEPSEYEVILPSLSGTPPQRYYREASQPRIDESGRPTAVTVIMDITELKQSKMDVIESEERYRRLVELLPDAVFIVVGGKIVFCNSACIRLFGADSAEQIVGKSPFELFHPDFHERIHNGISTMLQTGESAAGTRKRIVRLDGRDFPVYISATPITDRGADGILFCLNDLTERERATEVLHSVLGSVEDAILNIDEHGTVQLANPAMERLFGYAGEEVIGQNIKMLMRESYVNEHNGSLHNNECAGLANVIGSVREVAGQRKDGTTFPIELRVTEFQLNGQHHFTGVIRDISARKRLETQFQQSQKMEAVGTLAGGVAHDFNNLLTVINGYGDLLLKDLPGDSSQRDSVLAILEAGERATRLTQQLLAFSRKAIVEPKIVDLNELVEKTGAMLRRLIEEDIALTLIYDSALPRIKADQGQLEQVLVNTVVNARDSMPGGGKLLIETRRVDLGKDAAMSFPDLIPGTYAQLSVTDTGHGMTREVAEKIFEPFFTTKEVGKGTGLGLSVVHGIVKQCGGTVSVESEVNMGTTFKYLFPVAPEMVVGSPSETSRSAVHGHETILIVEDEDAVRKIVRSALESKGYRVLEANGGTQAIQSAEAYPGQIDLLITDVVMPDMGGPKVAEAIKRLRPGIRILFISGYTDDAVLQRGVKDANESFLQKPFTGVSLARKVRAVLDEANVNQ